MASKRHLQMSFEKLSPSNSRTRSMISARSSSSRRIPLKARSKISCRRHSLIIAAGCAGSLSRADLGMRPKATAAPPISLAWLSLSLRRGSSRMLSTVDATSRSCFASSIEGTTPADCACSSSLVSASCESCAKACCAAALLFWSSAGCSPSSPYVHRSHVALNTHLLHSVW